MITAYVFGGMEALAYQLQAISIAVSPVLLKMLPYLATVIVLVIVSIANRKKGATGPEAMTIPFSRGQLKKRCRAMNNMTETTAFGEAFLRDWYRKIDGKAPFSELARLTVGERGLWSIFRTTRWIWPGLSGGMPPSAATFAGEHCIHSIKVTEEADAIVIFSEITWRAKRTRRARPSSLPRM